MLRPLRRLLLRSVRRPRFSASGRSTSFMNRALKSLSSLKLALISVSSAIAGSSTLWPSPGGLGAGINVVGFNRTGSGGSGLKPSALDGFRLVVSSSDGFSTDGSGLDTSGSDTSVFAMIAVKWPSLKSLPLR